MTNTVNVLPDRKLAKVHLATSATTKHLNRLPPCIAHSDARQLRSTRLLSECDVERFNHIGEEICMRDRDVAEE